MVNKVLPPNGKTASNYHEIAVVGGGLAGLVAAAAVASPLAARGQKLAIIEKQPFASHLTPAFDGRTTAIAWQGQQLLREIGLWPQLVKLAEPIESIRVADTFGAPGLTFDSKELGQGAFGYIIENRHLRTILLSHLRTQKNIDIYNPASVNALDLTGPTATITLDTGKQLNAALVLAADGKNSALRKLVDIETFDLSYDQKALVCVVACAAPHNNIALEHFLPEGPFAMLPMQPAKNGRGNNQTLMSIVWTVKPDTAAALLALDEADFIAAMVEAGAGYMQPLYLATSVAAFPLTLRHARHYTAPHLALVGEAAHAIHPIAGQGFNLGLRDIACLRDSLITAHARGLRADDASVLNAYNRQRRADNQRMVGATDLLDRLFSTGQPVLTRLRQRGLAMVNGNGPLRRFFMRQAMGMKVA